MDDPIEPAADVRPHGHARWRRRVLWTAVAAILAMATVLALAVVSALAVRRHLEDGRAALTRGRTALIGGDAAVARDDFAAASAAFGAGADSARSPWLSLAGGIPILGRTPDTVRAVADAGVETAQAATLVAGAIADLPGGLESLEPTAAGIPLDNLAALTAAVERADQLTGRAVDTLQQTPSGLVLSPVAAARDLALQQLEDIHRQLDAGSLILRGLPGFLGADGPRHYFFGASNPAELRGTGGLIGAYAILTVDGGRLSLSAFRPVQTLPRLQVQDVPSPSPEYSRNFDFFRDGVGFWLNVNMTPDFPLAAKAIWLAYEQATGERLDGVIVTDPFALKALMQVTGAVDVNGTGTRVTAANVVPFVTNQAYALFDTNEERKRVLGRVALSVLNSFLAQTGGSHARLRALLDGFQEGHVKVWTDDSSMERGLELTSVGGAFRPSGTDALSVITNSFSGTKLDFYQKRSIAYDVQLGPGGQGAASLVVALTNDSPTSGYPPYVIGPYKRFSTQPGENVALVHLYCGAGCSLQGATEDGKPVSLRGFQQDGYPFFEDYVRTSSGDTARIAANLLLPHAWTGSDLGGTYRLSFIGQTTIRPIDLRIVIHPPAGMRITSVGDHLRKQGDVAIYDGHPALNLDLQVSFAPSLPVRIWRDVEHAVT